MSLLKRNFYFEDFDKEFQPWTPNLKKCMLTRFEFLSTYRNQSFSLPNSIMYYISKNPSTSKLYQKMVQSCKYFFIKNPIVVVDSLYLYGGELPEILTSNNSTKIWITKELPTLIPVSSFISKIYKCDFSSLDLKNVSISFDEYLLLSSSAKFVSLNNVKIQYDNGTDVEFEKIVEVCPNVTTFAYIFPPNPSNLSSESVKNLIKIPHFSNMKKLFFFDIPDTFDIKTLIEFLKKTDLSMYLEFSHSLSFDFRLKLFDIAEEILFKDLYIYGPPPYIEIPGLDEEIQALLKQAAGL